MSLAEELAAKAAQSVRADRPTHPQGWEPGISWAGTHGTITSRPIAEPTPDWDSLIRTWGFDPAVVEIVEPVQVRTWDAAIGNGEVRTMWYYRAGIRQRRAGAPDVAELVAWIRKRKPAVPLEVASTGAYGYAASDWQIGKKGTTAAAERILQTFDDSARRIRELRRMGRTIDTIYLFGLGDLHEGCKDHYAMQEFEVELDNRAQQRLVRHLWSRMVEVHAPLAPRIVCAAIGGNHGEERKDGKAFTTFADNKDVGSVEAAAEAFRQRTGYEHVSWLLPEGDLTLTLDMAGTIVGLAHGHQARRGGTPQQKVREWWKDQAFGRRPVGDADILLTGHYHHLSVLSDGGRTHIQAPTMDSGSQWWEETAGMPTTPGALTFTVQGGRWGDLQLL